MNSAKFRPIKSQSISKINWTILNGEWPYNKVDQPDCARPSRPLLAQSLRRCPSAPVPTGQALRASFAAYSVVIRTENKQYATEPPKNTQYQQRNRNLKMHKANLLVLFLATQVYCKRPSHVDLPPVLYGQMKISARTATIHALRNPIVNNQLIYADYQIAYLGIIDTLTNHWRKVEVYRIEYNPKLETDVQDVYITKMDLVGDLLSIENEVGEKIMINLKTNAVLTLYKNPKAVTTIYDRLQEFASGSDAQVYYYTVPR